MILLMQVKKQTYRFYFYLRGSNLLPCKPESLVGNLMLLFFKRRKIMKRTILSLFMRWTLLVMLLAACTTQPASAPAAAAQVPAAPGTSVAQVLTPGKTEVILATTTSTRDSGLLDVLLPLFEKETGYKVKMVAVGTGQALKMGQDGNADVLLVHAPSSEATYMKGGFGKERFLVMHNDFIIVGPKTDLAGVNGSVTTNDAFNVIAKAKATFVSRGDNSGTNTAELNLWKSSGITPSGDWYIKTGQGMGDTLRIASEKAGYTLTDRATYLALKDTLDLKILYQGDKALLNIYHVITVNPDKFTNINYMGGKAFADWIVSPGTQKFISNFGVDKYGQSLFFPDAGKSDDAVK
jgi:tungstate transport system substrate-binding protein